MSEVSDATQIIMMTARGGYLLGKISIAMASRTLKLLDTLYHAKWKGKTSFNRLRQTKGEDLLFINISTEDEEKLRLVERELDAHQIMFARLPDLCGGDGRTQYAISQSDMEHFRAFLLDHGDGRYRDILVGPVRPEDYLSTGEDDLRNNTPQMKDLEEDARKEAGTTCKEEKAIRIFSEGTEKRVPSEQFAQEVSGIYSMCMHEKGAAYGEKGIVFRQAPVKEEENFNLYMMPDGVRMVVIPKEDVQSVHVNEGTGETLPPVFTVFTAQRYVIYDPMDGVQDMVRGDDLTRLLEAVPAAAKHKELSNLIQSRLAPAVEEVIKNNTKR